MSPPQPQSSLLPRSTNDAIENCGRQTFRQSITVIVLGAAMICCSAGLIAFNKYLMTDGRFPYALPIVLNHMFFNPIISLLLFLVRPSVFPSLTDPDRKVEVDFNLIVMGLLPIAALFSVHLVLSNMAYLYSTVAFLQFLKEGNVVLVYVFSVMLGLERFGYIQLSVLIGIVVATAVTINGELHFALAGFLLQGTSIFAESAKVVLQQMVLQRSGRKLDAFSYVLLVTPLCFVMLGSVLAFLVLSGHGGSVIQLPSLAEVITWWPWLLMNACVAYMLNVVIALFVQASSAVGFVLAGILKDISTVMAGVFLIGEVVSYQQQLSFPVQIALILVWSMIKLHPDWISKFQSDSEDKDSPQMTRP